MTAEATDQELYLVAVLEKRIHHRPAKKGKRGALIDPNLKDDEYD